MSTDLSAFPITRKWPAAHPDRLQLYSLPTPNGVKVSIALEELGIPYEAHLVSFETNDQFTPEFLSLNPNNKIPAILDPAGPGGAPFGLWESGAILIYLAEKAGALLPADPARRYETLQWVMFQMGGVGPMFGQLGFFYVFAGKDFEDKRPRDRYAAESKRLLGVLDRHLAGKAWIMGEDFTIADIAVFPWINNLLNRYKAGELNQDAVIVVRHNGPAANGMPELHKLMPVLGNLQKAGHKVALVTDGRLSGASGKIPAAIHVTPEALHGGAIGLLANGDLLRVDAESGRLDCLTDLSGRTQAEIDLTLEQEGWGRELFSVMRRAVSSAECGATIFD